MKTLLRGAPMTERSLILGEAADCITMIHRYTDTAHRVLGRDGTEPSAELRLYIDRVRNALQALEGCAAALETGAQMTVPLGWWCDRPLDCDCYDCRATKSWRQESWTP